MKSEEVISKIDRPLPKPVDFGGDGGDRTLDLTDANRTLSQLSYAPVDKLLKYHISFAVKSQGVKYKFEEGRKDF